MRQTRPDLTSHIELLLEIVAKVNEEALYSLSVTDIVKLAIERMWLSAFPGRALPTGMKRKRYIRLQF